jgi:hypothetical protein
VRAAIVDAPRLGVLDAVVVQPEGSTEREQRTDAEIDTYARDLGVDAVLAVEATRQNLDVEFERRLAHYQSEGTADQRIATAHFTQVAMDTGASYDFIRYIIIDSARLPELTAIPVQFAVQ